MKLVSMKANEFFVVVDKETMVVSEDKLSATVRGELLHPGTFPASTGEIKVTKERIHNLTNNYNKQLTSLVGKMKSAIGIDDQLQLPIQVDHNLSNEKTVGRLKGTIEVMVNEADSEKLCMMATLKILGPENIQKVIDGRFRNLSVSFDEETDKLIEVSFVTYGADDEARALSSNVEKINAVALEQAHAKIAELEKDKAKLADLEKENAELKKSTQEKAEKAVQLTAAVAEERTLLARKSLYAKVNKLYQEGKIPVLALKGGLLETLEKSSAPEEILKVLAQVEPCINKTVQSKNAQANTFQKLILDGGMKKDITETQVLLSSLAEAFEDSTQEVKDDLSARLAEKLTEKKGYDDEGSEELSKFKKGHEKFLKHLQELAESGEHDKIKEELGNHLKGMCKFTSEEDDEETDMSKAHELLAAKYKEATADLEEISKRINLLKNQ